MRCKCHKCVVFTERWWKDATPKLYFVSWSAVNARPTLSVSGRGSTNFRNTLSRSFMTWNDRGLLGYVT